MFDSTDSIYIPDDEVARWRIALRTILQRLRQGRFRPLKVSRSFRRMLGSHAVGTQKIRYHGRLGGHSHHIVSVGESMYLLADFGGMSALPISQEELAIIELQLA